MLSRVFTAALNGIDSHMITVETDISRGLPAFYTVGLPSVTIKEAKERMRSAIMNSGYDFPVKRITVNLSPAGSRKEGSHFDLPMAVGILISNGELLQSAVEDTGFFGELSLDGRLRKISGALPLAMGIRENGLKKIIIPKENADETGIAPEIEIYPAETLSEVVEHLKGTSGIPVYSRKERRKNSVRFEQDFSEVSGQEAAKRAITVAVAGRHGIYLSGSPGSGKTMMALRIPGIMPELEEEEVLELTKIYSIAGLINGEEGPVTDRPFRMPYHGASTAALLGGGRNPRPGEISLAHKGVLFMDEFPEFRREVAEKLRQPMETGEVHIERVAESVKFPAEFMLVAAGNPCKCGYFGDSERKCRCTMKEINSYQSKLSGPLLDRIDIQIKAEKIKIDELESWGQGLKNTSSQEMKKLVTEATFAQKQRYGREEKYFFNSRLSGAYIKKYCFLDKNCMSLMREAYVKMGLSARGYEKVIKVARTIADMEGCENIQDYQIAEALRYRVLDGLYIKG